MNKKANKILLDYFDESGFDPRHTVVRCATQDEANIFIDYLCLKGVRDPDSSAKLKSAWVKYKGSTCYHLSECRWCYESWYAENCPELRIVDFCDIYTPPAESYNITYSYEELFE